MQTGCLQQINGLHLLAKLATLVLTMAIGLNLVACSKGLPGDTTFKEATKRFEKEMTKDQRKAAIKQLQTETEGGASRP